MDKQEIQNRLGLSHRENFRYNYPKSALKQGFIGMKKTYKLNIRLQKHHLTTLSK